MFGKRNLLKDLELVEVEFRLAEKFFVRVKERTQ